MIAAFSQSGPQVTYYGLPQSEVSLHASSSLTFQTAIGTYLDGDAIAFLQPIIPYSVVVRNDGPMALIAIVVRYSLTEASGKTTTHQFMLSTMSNRPNSMILSGEAAFIGPISGMNRILRLQGQSRANLTDPARFSPQLLSRAGIYQRSSSVKIALDSVVYADGSVIGPDEAGNMERMNAWRRADIDLYSELRNRSGSGMESYLRQVVDSPRESGATYAEANHYEDRFDSTAKELLLLRTSSKSDHDVVDFLKNKVTAQIPQLYRRTR
jgi:hypothetical protein